MNPMKGVERQRVLAADSRHTGKNPNARDEVLARAESRSSTRRVGKAFGTTSSNKIVCAKSKFRSPLRAQVCCVQSAGVIA